MPNRGLGLSQSIPQNNEEESQICSYNDKGRRHICFVSFGSWIQGSRDWQFLRDINAKGRSMHAPEPQHEYYSARQLFTKAIKLNPDDPCSHHNRATVYSNSGHYAGAVKEFNESVFLIESNVLM